MNLWPFFGSFTRHLLKNGKLILMVILRNLIAVCALLISALSPGICYAAADISERIIFSCLFPSPCLERICAPNNMAIGLCDPAISHIIFPFLLNRQVEN